MERLKFSSDGRLANVDGMDVSEKINKKKDGEKKYSEMGDDEFIRFGGNSGEFSEGLGKRFASVPKYDEVEEIRSIKDGELEDKNNFVWGLYQESGENLAPLKFSNGKTQTDVVKEIIQAVEDGHKVIFLKGSCGTGKSAIALNVAKALGKASIVVPVKGLQRQYEEDYVNKKYLLKKGGQKMKIAMITGRDNHDSVIQPGKSCADPYLPDTVMLTDKNSAIIRQYYNENPFIKNKVDMPTNTIKRLSIAPTNPYWSPIVPAEVELPLVDAKKKRYRGLRGREFVFYYRKAGCGYYDQYLAYLYADVLIFNSAKYKIELALDRKPETAVDIIDEADEFLDNFSNQQELNITRMIKAMKNVMPEGFDAQKDLIKIEELLKGEEKNKQAIGIAEDGVFKLKETNIEKALTLLLKSKEIQAEIMLDELNYANKLLEAGRNFEGFFEDTYVNYQMREGDLYANLVTVNLARKFREMQEKSNALIFMSGTMHSEEVLKHIFGLDKFKIIEAETSLQGNVEIVRTGKEFDCRYSNLTAEGKTKKDYLKVLEACVAKAKKPILIHVNAYDDLPTEQEIKDYWIFGLLPKEKLKELQNEDKTGKLISMFKAKLSDTLFTTKCARGVDFPGDICNSVVFTKYPNPNIRDPFWKILKNTHPDYFWEFYHDKARREFQQRLFRAIRSKDDHVYVLSPDKRVLDAVRELQMQSAK